MEHNETRSNPTEGSEPLEQRTDELDERIREARDVSEQARPDPSLPFAVGDFNEDSSDGPGGEGVTPETNYTTRGD